MKKLFTKLLAPLLILVLTLAPVSAQFSGDGAGFRIDGGLYGIGDSRVAPLNTVAPAITGTATVSFLLTTSDGTWTGFPTPTFTYQWNRNGVAIGGATSSTYTLVTADNGTTVTSTVTATNIGGIASTTSTGVVVSDPAGDFIARTSGLDATHQTAFTTLINGLITDSVWSKLDALYIYATQGSGNATLNLKSATYNSVIHGSPTFTTDRGFTGTLSSTTIYIDTTFTPSTATSPNFVRNSGHVSIWSLTSGGSLQVAFGADDGTSSTLVAPRLLPSGSGFFRANETVAGGSDNTPVADGSGHFLVSRTGASVVPAYRNGASILAGTMASVVVGTKPFYSIGDNQNGTASGSDMQLAMASIGGGLTATDTTNFYNRLRTYMTTVGVP